MDVIQEVEYVKQENKLPYLLHCLQKTEPPALVFCENKKDVDDIQEYLLLKGVDAVAIHGGLAQEERSEAIRLFKYVFIFCFFCCEGICLSTFLWLYGNETLRSLARRPQPVVRGL